MRAEVNIAFLTYIEREAVALTAKQDITFENALERMRKQATIDLLDGHMKYNEESGEFFIPQVCGTDCISCTYPDVS